ncbi:urate oxidase [Pseudarcicella hirudinis]|uniref:Uricase n=1 Tax=Pseudarcicella hirudinis TaxID=1079859 RepID=A0A1I5S302_9BACT|nr:urate oxidase [Pseudarcicella hirudinis]SFP65037.1 urate oxidase [Pseudarcicella hirudinis]
MAIKLGKNAYGKNAINLSKIIRHDDCHEFRQISVNVSLEGDFETAHTFGDNSRILPTDTQKNTVYALAKEYFTGSIEEFGIHLSKHFFSKNPQVSEVKIEIAEFCWKRMNFEGNPHTHSFVNGGNEKHTTIVQQNADGIYITSGIKDLLILKTTDSSFTNYIKDEYTTLKEADDRIFATECEASWEYSSDNLNFTEQYDQIRNLLLKTFADHKSLCVQQTLFEMGEKVLENYETVKEISLKMPNKHHILFNLEQFGIPNRNEIFIATDEPYGYITGTVIRD